VEKDDVVAPQRGGALPSQGVRQVQPGAPKKTDNLQRGGAGLAPPEFREAHMKFTRELFERERTREKK